MRLSSRVFLLGLVVLLALTSSGLAQRDAALREFAAWAEAEMKKDSMPGLSIAVLDDGELWARGFGLADVENQVPATEKSSYRMASVTKPMTAVAALRLAEKGLLDLDAPIQTYVPYFPDKGQTITVRHLLGHLGGISHYRDYMVEGRIREPKTTRQAIAIFEGFDLVAPPGERYSYSSYGFNLAGAAIEAAAGKPFGEVMRELVWEPAGMTGARMDDPRAIIPNRVDGYTLDGGTLRRSEFVDISSRFAGGGTRATVVDMVRFAAALDEGKLLQKESLDAMWSSQATTAGRFTEYGLGWSTAPVNGRFQVNHGGAQQETRTFLSLFPGENLAIALASNFEDANLGKYRDRLYWHLTGEIWVPQRYASDRRDRLALRLAEGLYDAGRFQFEKQGRAMTTDPRELAAAFAVVQKLAAEIEAGAPGTENAIADAIHPSAGQPLGIAGSYIAARLAGREQSRYYQVGELAFVEDYIELYRRDGSVPRAYRLPRNLERRIIALSDAWEASWTPDVRAMVVEGAAAADRLGAALEEKGTQRVLPSVIRELVAGVEISFGAGDHERAARLAALAARLYPEDSESTGVQGVMLSLSGHADEGRALLAKSASLAARGYAGPANLRNIARFVAGAGMTGGALVLLENAAEVHPRDAATLAALGEAYAAAGRTADARSAFERALAIDPTSKEAKAGLATLP